MVLGLTTVFAACAQGQINGVPVGGSGGVSSLSSTSSSSSASSSSGTGGDAGTGGTGTGGTGGSSTSSSSSSSSGANLCGNGMVDPGEDCDGSNLAGATCMSLGFETGTLTCNQFCHFVVSGCTPFPNCLDPSVSCADPGCVGKPGCVDACMPALPAQVPGFVDGDNTARPSNVPSSCSSATPGPEEIFKVTPSQSGTMSLDLSSFDGVNYSLSVRTACADQTTEIACSNKPNQQQFGDITLGVTVTMGQTYYVIVQGMTPTDVGQYSLDLEIPQPEDICDNLIDDDLNGYTDCDDMNCQMTSPSCVPGTTPNGGSCFANTDCSAAHQDPICLDDFDFPAFPNGYCSEFCNATTLPCSAGNVCYTGLNISMDGVCLHECTMDSDCRTADGYACVSKGLSSKVCALGPETICNDYIDNDFNNLTDCDDPNCQATSPDCVPGSNAIGQPCTVNTQCTASVGINNPVCLDELDEGYPNGYCSHFCDPSSSTDCGANGLCVPNGPDGENVCFQTCTTNTQCRVADGYSCQNVGFSKNICTF